MRKINKKIKKRKSFSHLNDKKRDRLEALIDVGSSQKEIAKILKVDGSTISREISKRKKEDGHYDAEVAESKALIKRSNSKYQGMKIEKHPLLKKRIQTELKACRSPDEITGMFKTEKLDIRIGTNALYKWLYSPYGQKYCKYLCTRRYKKKKSGLSVKRVMIRNRIGIEERPKTKGLIHAEGDTLVSGKKTGSKVAASMVAIQKSKLMLGDILTNLEPKSMKASVVRIKKVVKIDTMTLDNGIENRTYEEFGLPVYFCNPYSPWEKGLVEQSIGLLRRWYIKKGTNLSTISPKKYQDMLHYFNHKKRKSLGYKSAYEKSLEYGIIQTLPSEKIAFQPRI